MGISIISNSGIKTYGIKHFIVDTEAEVNTVSTDCAPGSTIFILETSQSYMLNTKHKWISVNLNSAGGNSSSDLDNTDTIIFNGGTPGGSW